MAKKVRILGSKNAPGLKAPKLEITFDAAELAQAISEATQKHTQKSIRAGKKPSGGKQKPLSKENAKKAAKGKRSGVRGMGYRGRFEKELRTRKARGELRATGTLATERFFDQWQGKEATRGVEYLEVIGEADEILIAAIEKMLRKQGLI